MKSQDKSNTGCTLDGRTLAVGTLGKIASRPLAPSKKANGGGRNPPRQNSQCRKFDRVLALPPKASLPVFIWRFSEFGWRPTF